MIMDAARLTCLFQSTLSVRRATNGATPFQADRPFQSTLSVRRATPVTLHHGRCHVISIHALREESDIFDESYRAKLNEFQSTLSVRRATGATDATAAEAKFQSTLSVRRATVIVFVVDAADDISIHALREESDRISDRPWTPAAHFNPRSP